MKSDRILSEYYEKQLKKDDVEILKILKEVSASLLNTLL